MEENREPSPVDKYEYFRDLPIDTLIEHLTDIDVTFQEVQRHYTGPFGRFRRKLRAEDMAQLVECIEDLLPMSGNQGAQAELMSGAIEDPELLTLNQIGRLTMDIMVFAGRFDNTGITVYSGSEGILN